MAGMSLTTGLISGMDTGGLISQLMQVEANPQTLLKTQLTATKNDATAYRSVNTRFDALRTAAEALTKPSTWALTKATSSSSTVTATTGSSALPGSVTFAVTSLAATHAVVSDADWSASTAEFGLSSLEVWNADRTVLTGTIPVPSSTAGSPATLADAVAAINASSLKLTASAVQVADGKYRLQVTAKDSGSAAGFSFGPADTYDVVTSGADATLKVGTGVGAYTVTSASNTFADLMPDTTLTVTAAAPATQITVGVASDPDAVAAKVSALVSAANSVLTSIDSTASGDGAVLRGDSTLRALASQILDAASYAVGGDGNAGVAGLNLNKSGSIDFTVADFTAKLKADPALVQRLFAGTPASGSTPAVAGIAGRLQQLAKNASDATTGSLTMLANGSDAAAKELTDRISDWDLRLALRKDTLTRQFTAMETALGTLQNQSSWLSSQINSLPSWSSSSKS
jgi:flagellar hook-associated protein 2